MPWPWSSRMLQSDSHANPHGYPQSTFIQPLTLVPLVEGDGRFITRAVEHRRRDERSSWPARCHGSYVGQRPCPGHGGPGARTRRRGRPTACRSPALLASASSHSGVRRARGDDEGTRSPVSEADRQCRSATWRRKGHRRGNHGHMPNSSAGRSVIISRRTGQRCPQRTEFHLEQRAAFAV